MIGSLYIAESGLDAQQKLIDVVSNNITNSATPGFKKSRIDFTDLVFTNSINNDQNIGQKYSAPLGAGVSVSTNIIDFSIGTIKRTNRPLDIYINGDGFIEVNMEDGEVGYTRAGELMLDNDRYLATSNGHRLTSNISVPQDVTDIKIDSNGIVTGMSDYGLVEFGKIELAKFDNNRSLELIGDKLYRSSDGFSSVGYNEPGDNGTGTLIQGAIELSNVSMNEEMVNLMIAQRAYQLNARLIQVSDQVMDTINNLRR